MGVGLQVCLDHCQTDTRNWEGFLLWGGQRRVTHIIIIIIYLCLILIWNPRLVHACKHKRWSTELHKVPQNTSATQSQTMTLWIHITSLSPKGSCKRERGLSSICVCVMFYFWFVHYPFFILSENVFSRTRWLLIFWEQINVQILP